MPSPLVSVVMPVRDCAPTLGDAIESILGQTFGDFELIAVDDGSTDATPAVLGRYAAADPRVRVISNTGRGISEALNRGIGEASAPLIARMDGDDRSRPGRLAAQVAFLEANPGTVALGTQVMFFGGSQKPTTSSYPLDPSSVRHTMRRTNCLAHPTVVMRRDAVTAVGGYRPLFRRAEDYDLWLRLLETGDIANLDIVGLDYRLHISMSSLRDAEAQVFETIVARRLAECRLHGDPESDIGPPPITREALERLGADRRMVARVVRKTWFSAARTSRRMGDAGQRRQCLARAGPPRMPGGGVGDYLDYAWRWAKVWL